MLLSLACILSTFVIITQSAPANDLVSNLPGLNFKPNFKHYSGYLQASKLHYLHYWYVESEGTPSTDPVILWLNGGPGCSSVGGLMTELGPFRAKDFGKTIFENVYAWNKVGNVIFLEAPAGVGYSYATDGNVQTSDDKTAADNHQALIYFFQWKFPELKKNDFFITGESYAGVYLPTLGVLLANDKANFPNFKGMAVGNGILHFKLNTNTLVPLLYNHALIRQNLFDKMNKECCNGNPMTCDYYSLYSDEKCGPMVMKEMGARNGLDPYNLYTSCYLPSTHDRAFIRDSILRHSGIKPDDFANGNPNQTLIPVCAQENATFVYMNRDDVRTALHIPSFLPTWHDCSGAVGGYYQSNYDNMISQVNAIADAGVRVLIYNGDVDSVCNAIMNKQFLELLGRDVINDSTPYTNQKWYYAHEEPDIAGYVTYFQGGIDFVTVRGAGHFVPADKGRESLQMIYNFVHHRDYSTPSGLDTEPQPLVG